MLNGSNMQRKNKHDPILIPHNGIQNIKGGAPGHRLTQIGTKHHIWRAAQVKGLLIYHGRGVNQLSPI